MQISGNNGCNNFRGSIEVLNTSDIKFGSIINTKKLCFEKKIPNAFNDAITEVRSYNREGLELTLFDKEGVVIVECHNFD